MALTCSIWQSIPTVLAVVLLALLSPTAEAKAMWSLRPASTVKFMREAYPIGNGRLGALPFGQPGQEKLNLNVDSLWSGGPFEDAAYNGGNPKDTKARSLPNIRANIFRSGTGNITQLLGTNNHYGSFRVLANLSIVLQGISQYSHYNRSLDLTTGMHTTSFLANDRNTYTTVSYCSYPAKTCIYRLSSTGQLPNVAISLENRLVPQSLYNATCGASFVRLTGVTQAADRSKPKGMEYDVIARLSTGPLGMPMSTCSTNQKGTIVVTGSAYGKDLSLNSVSVVVGAATDYDATKGTPQAKYSFRGPKPGPALERVTAQASTKIENKLMVAHQQDYQRLMGGFQLQLFDPWKASKYPSESLEFFQLLDRYKHSAGISGNNKRRAAISKEQKRDTRNAEMMTTPIKAHQAKVEQNLEKAKHDSNTENMKNPQEFKDSKEDKNARAFRDSKDIKNAQAEQQTTQGTFIPKTSAIQSTWASVATNDPFPAFDFPTNLATGVTHTTPIPWSTNGILTVTGAGGAKQTVTLTMTPAAGPTRLIDLKELETDLPYTENNATQKWEKRSPDTNEAESSKQQDPTDPSVAQGDPYVESLLFDYARHLFISSSREDSLPPNLQGVWADTLESAWSGDYHANINLQMNHWFADQVGLGQQQHALFNYIQNTWLPRGTETARLLYNAPGWVTHDEMNIFGHTGMKNTPQWANYPIAAAWMMQTVFDHWDYSRDLGWLQTVGYNMIRQVAQFWLSQLQPDNYSRDNTLVVNPCNSPERGPTTFGCAHYQQIIHQLFVQTLLAAYEVNDADTAFTDSLNTALDKLDGGIHYTTWGGIKEFKLPEAMGQDIQGDKHRHLSQLIGWYPGYSIASFTDGFSNPQIQSAVAASLRSRGNGNADGNVGWAKVWRAAAWARLNDTEQADYHLRYAIFQNIGLNGLSIYDGRGGPFQIDANFGLAAAMLSMLVYDVPQTNTAMSRRVVVLGPAIPPRWGPGKVKGLRIRGGTVVDMEWNNRGVVTRLAVQKAGESCAFYSKENKLIGQI